MEPIIIEVRLAPDIAALLKSFAPSSSVVNQFPPQSPAEQAARMRMQPPPVPMPQQPAPTYTQQQYQLEPGSTPAAPLGTKPLTGVASAYMNGSNVQTTVPVAPTYNQPSAPVNPMPPTAAAPASPAGQSTAQPAAVPSNPVPVAGAPTYELDQLARATATLADAGKMQQIQQLFQQFQIQQLTQIPKERYGEYATALRQLGVRI